jgi:hypothetical protein
MRFFLYILFCIKSISFQYIFLKYFKNINNNIERNKKTKLKDLNNIKYNFEETDEINSCTKNNYNITNIILHIEYKKTLDILSNNNINNIIKLKSIDNLKYINNDSINSSVILNFKKGGLFDDWDYNNKI